MQYDEAAVATYVGSEVGEDDGYDEGEEEYEGEPAGREIVSLGVGDDTDRVHNGPL